MHVQKQKYRFRRWKCRSGGKNAGPEVKMQVWMENAGPCRWKCRCRCRSLEGRRQVPRGGNSGPRRWKWRSRKQNYRKYTVRKIACEDSCSDMTLSEQVFRQCHVGTPLYTGGSLNSCSVKWLSVKLFKQPLLWTAALCEAVWMNQPKRDTLKLKLL